MMSGALPWRQGLLQAKTGIGTPEGGEPHLPNVGFGSEPDVQRPASPGPLLAISGHTATRRKSKIGCTEISLEPVQISLGIVRISGSPQKGTEKGSLPHNPNWALSLNTTPIGQADAQRA